jgi:hypothetical protein
MSNEPNSEPDNLTAKHPVCPTCGVPMWLTRIENAVSEMVKDRLHYECKVCDATAIVSPQT